MSIARNNAPNLHSSQSTDRERKLYLLLIGALMFLMRKATVPSPGPVVDALHPRVESDEVWPGE